MTTNIDSPVFVSGDVARRVFAWPDAIEALRASYRLPESAGATPPRSVATVGKAWLRTLPAIPPTGRYFGAKLMGTGVQGVASGIDYVIVLFDRQTSQIAAFLDAASITAFRTAATSALALDMLAPKAPARLAVLGSGLEATHHARAFASVRPLTEVVVFSPTPERRRAFAASLAKDLGVAVRDADSAEAAVGGADIVLAAARAQGEVPILFGDMIAAKAAGIDFRSKAFSLNELASGGRRACVEAAGMRLFKSVGGGLQDVVVAEVILARALETGLATPLPIQFEHKR